MHSLVVVPLNLSCPIFLSRLLAHRHHHLPVSQGRAAMTQMNESTAARLTPARAAELVQVLELQSRWENLRADGNHSTVQLQSLQNAFEAYRSRLANFVARDQSDAIPELTPTKPGRLGIWARTVRAVLKLADDRICPTHIVAKAHRVANQIAIRLKSQQGVWETPTDMPGAIFQLDRVIAWCDDQIAEPRAQEVAAVVA